MHFRKHWVKKSVSRGEMGNGLRGTPYFCCDKDQSFLEILLRNFEFGFCYVHMKFGHGVIVKELNHSHYNRCVHKTSRLRGT